MNWTLVLGMGTTLSIAIALIMSMLQTWNNYRNPTLRPHPVIDLEQISGEAGFTWIKMELVTSNVFPPPTGRADGAMWKGLSLGVSRETGKVATISITIYGPEQGVGHYTWFAVKSPWDKEVGQGGHFHLMRLDGESQSAREERIMGYAIDAASRGVNGYYRPLQFTYDAESRAISSMYDPESGRQVFLNPYHLGWESPSLREQYGEGYYAFGPPPMVNDLIPYVHQPGAYLQPLIHLRPSTPTNQYVSIMLRAWDVYGVPLDHVMVQIDSDTGYKYSQILHAEQTNGGGIEMSLPVVFLSVESPQIQVIVTRAGYHPISQDIALKEGTQPIDIYMEPKCRLQEVSLLCSE